LAGKEKEQIMNPKSNSRRDTDIGPLLRQVRDQQEEKATRYLAAQGTTCLSIALIVQRIREGGWLKSEEAHIYSCERCKRLASKARKTLCLPGVVFVFALASLVDFYRLSSTKVLAACLATLFIGAIPMGIHASKVPPAAQTYVSIVDETPPSSPRARVRCTFIQDNSQTVVILANAFVASPPALPDNQIDHHQNRPHLVQYEPEHDDGVRQAASCVERVGAELEDDGTGKAHEYQVANDPRISALLAGVQKLAPPTDRETAAPGSIDSTVPQKLLALSPYLVSIVAMGLLRFSSRRKRLG
jgi:hypothetical protein